MLNQNNARIRGFGFLKIFLALPIAAILLCMFFWAGAKTVFFGVGDVLAGHVFSEDARYQSVANDAWRSSSVNWEAMKTSTVIWQYHLLEQVNDDSILPSSEERSKAELVLDLDYPYKSLGTCQSLADKVMPVIEGWFPSGIQDRKDFSAKPKIGNLEEQEAFIVFRAVHPQIREGHLTVFRVKFSQVKSSNLWRYEGIEYVRNTVVLLPYGYRKPSYSTAYSLFPSLSASGDLPK